MSPGILGWNQQDVLAQFQNRKAAVMINGPWQIPTLKKDNPDLKWQVVTLPQNNPDLKWQVVTLPQNKQGASILGAKTGDRQGRQEYRRGLGADLVDPDIR